MMRSRYFQLLTLIALISSTACREEHAMNDLEDTWAAVLDSQTPEEEAAHVEALRLYISEHDIPFRAVVVDAEGREIPVGDLGADDEWNVVRVTFYLDEGEYEAPAWSPRDAENLYALFLE